MNGVGERGDINLPSVRGSVLLVQLCDFLLACHCGGLSHNTVPMITLLLSLDTFLTLLLLLWPNCHHSGIVDYFSIMYSVVFTFGRSNVLIFLARITQ